MNRTGLHYAPLFFALAITPFDGHAAGNDAPPAGKAQTEVLWELNPYYTSAALNVPLTDEAFPDGGRMKEEHVYRDLFLRSLKPNVFLLEASVYPMPILGTWMRKHQKGLYDSTTVGGGAHALNLVDSLTAGFQEPWAVSAFLGGQMKFSRPGEDEVSTNRGYMGYLVSAGNRHILNNVMINDDWMEFEWKMKGERKFKEERLSWNFRIGFKNHNNPDIADTVYLGISRSNLDFNSPFLSILDNSSLTLFTEFSQHHSTLVRQEIVFGKKYPLSSLRYALSVDFGVIYENASKYSGVLAPLAHTGLTLVFRPNIAF